MTFNGLTNKFYSKLKSLSNEIGTLVFNRSRGIGAYTDDQLKKLTPIYGDLFGDGKDASIKQIKGDITKLTKKYDVPMKYNRDLLLKMNDKSVFTGYFDKAYADVFSKREINKLKSTILQAKYSNMTESQLQTNILNTIKTTKKHAQQLARYEIQRLRSVTLNEYYALKKMKSTYDKVFVAHDDDRVRSTHKKLDGMVADEGGGIQSPDFGYITELPIPSQYNCRCRWVLRRKTK